jgi:hypothetical protein
MKFACQLLNGGSAPATPGFNAIAPEWLPGYGAAITAAPAIPAAESALGSHPCVALSSAQVLPEWISLTSSCNSFSANGDYPLNFVSHSRGSLQPALDPLVQLRQEKRNRGRRGRRLRSGGTALHCGLWQRNSDSGH